MLSFLRNSLGSILLFYPHSKKSFWSNLCNQQIFFKIFSKDFLLYFSETIFEIWLKVTSSIQRTQKGDKK